MNKNNQIQGLRGVGCILILFTHIVIKYTSLYIPDFKLSDSLNNISFLGSYGVAVFLIISGWFLYTPDSKRTNSVDVVLFKKFLKLWIPYVISITITYFLEHFLRLGDRTVTLKDYIVSLTMLQDFVVGINPVDGAHWYLATILVMYIGCLFIENAVTHKRIAYSIWLIIGIISSICEIKISGTMLQREYVGLIVSGIFLRRIYERLAVSKADNVVKETIKDTIVFLLGIVTLLKYHDYKYCIWAVLIFIIIYLCMMGKLRVLEFYPLVWIGEMSYFIYLIHQNLSFMIMNTMTDAIGSFSLWYTIVAAFVSVMVALFIKYISDWIFKFIAKINIK